MEKYPILSVIIQNQLPYFVDLFKGEIYDGILRRIEDGQFELEELVTEFDQAINDEELDWVEFAYKNEYLSPNKELKYYRKSYSDFLIIQDMKFYFSGYVYPELVYNGKEDLEQFFDLFEQELLDYPFHDGWVNPFKLYFLLKKNEKFKYIELYHIWNESLVYRGKILKEGRELKGKGVFFYKHKDWNSSSTKMY